MSFLSDLSCIFFSFDFAELTKVNLFFVCKILQCLTCLVHKLCSFSFFSFPQLVNKNNLKY